ncbi:MAG: CPBP family intramembrane metalloprotease [Candidatus Thermoplasmatota archaeon]|nr:CPBP family intramembrane metalloprotease [Candidatus Thermoplasmatota archaeon]
MTRGSLINWKVFLILFGASIFGVIAVMPFALTIQQDLLEQVPLPFPVIILLSIVQSAIMFFMLTLVGLVISKKIGFGAPILERLIEKKEVKTSIRSITRLSIGLGIIAGVLILLGDYIVSRLGNVNLDLTTYAIPVWQGFLASFYGAINEEIMLRLFFMSLIIWICLKIKKTENKKATNRLVWFAIFLAAILFGIVHLPFTAAITSITPLILVRAILLNGIGGVIFGWLYWKKGLESAMISHFSADIILYVLFPLIPF